MRSQGLVLAFAAACVHGAPGGGPGEGAGRTAPDAPAASLELRQLAERAGRELRTNILPFWTQHAPDEERGGFHGLLDPELRPVTDAPRGVLLTSRLLWTFSAAYRKFGDPAYRQLAERAYRDLTARGWDAQHGGVFWTVTADGTPVQPAKHVYGQAFAIYALSEYHRALRDPAALERAVALYRLVEAKARDRIHGGYFEGFARDWTRDDAGTRRIMGQHGPKSQNTHIHVLEAYTNLLRAWPDAQLRADLRSLLELMLNRIIDPGTGHLILFFRDDWTPVSDAVSYGHDIELSWLVVEAAEALGDRALLDRARATAVRMAHVTLAEGVDRDGAVFNEGKPAGPTNLDKDWWPQAEAVVGFLNAYEISRDARFAAAARRSWDAIEASFIDRRHGDWHETVARDGTPVPRPKLSLWKCPYHNSRACLETIERVERLAKQSKS